MTDLFHANVRLLDGRSFSIQYNAFKRVSDIVNELTLRLGIEENSETFGLYVDMENVHCQLYRDNSLWNELRRPRFEKEDPQSKLLLKKFIFRSNETVTDPNSMHYSFIQSKWIYLRSHCPLTIEDAAKYCYVLIAELDDDSIFHDEDQLVWSISENIPKNVFERVSHREWLRRIREIACQKMHVSKLEARREFLALMNDYKYGNRIKYEMQQRHSLALSTTLNVMVNWKFVYIASALMHEQYYEIPITMIKSCNLIKNDVLKLKFDGNTFKMKGKNASEIQRVVRIHMTDARQARRNEKLSTSLEKTRFRRILQRVPSLYTVEKKEIKQKEPGKFRKRSMRLAEEHQSHASSSSFANATIQKSGITQHKKMRKFRKRFMSLMGKCQPYASITSPPSSANAKARRDDSGESLVTIDQQVHSRRAIVESSEHNVRLHSTMMASTDLPSAQNEWNIENVDEDGAGPSNYQQESNSCDFNEIVEDELSNTSASFIATFGKNESDAGVFYPLELVHCLVEGKTFAGKFMITQTSLGNRENVLLARNLNYGSHVILKFYASKSLFENSRALHRELSNSSHVCKLLDDIEEKDFPPCLVFQKGDITLDEWLVKASPNPLDRKAVLYQILAGLIDIHRCGIIHCDLKPSNIMLFYADHKWKLIDFDAAAVHSRRSQISTTVYYAAPEILENEEIGKKDIVLEPSVDMFSFGIIFFEVLTGLRFYGPEAKPETINDQLLVQKKLPLLNCLDEQQARSLAEKLLSFDPRERPSAWCASKKAIFNSAETSSFYAKRWGYVTNALENLLKLQRLALDEITSANLILSANIERFLDQETSVAFHLRSGENVFAARDDFFPNEPIFLLPIQESHRLLINLIHSKRNNVPIENIVAVHIVPNGKEPIELEIRQIRKTPSKIEAAALLDPSSISCKELSVITPWFGRRTKRVVQLDLTVVVQRKEEAGTIELKHKIYCRIVKQGYKPKIQQFVRKFGESWENVPQAVRDAARASVLLLNLAINLS